MKIRVRRAKVGDRGLFRKLWKEFLDSQAALGHDILSNERNLDFYLKLFDLYMSGDLEGIILFVSEDAVLMWGSNGAAPPLEVRYGKKPALAWGSFVREGHDPKVGLKLEGKAINILKDLGFDYILRPIFRADKEQIERSEQLGFDPDTVLSVLEIE